MNDDYTRINEMKRKVRKLKKIELKLRFNNSEHSNQSLIWNRFFNLQDNKKGKYSLGYLLSIDREEFKKIIDEFFLYVYYEIYKVNGLNFSFQLYDPHILSKLGLPINANESDIKKRFRELANQYHPDKGGDPKLFIELMDNYKKLKNF